MRIDHGIRNERAPRGTKTRAILDYYEATLASLSYGRQNVDDRVLMLNSKNTALYHLVFASKHPRGRDFWQKAPLRLPSGQRVMEGLS